MNKNKEYNSKTIEQMFEEIARDYPYMEKQVHAKMLIAAAMDDKRKELGWSLDDMAKAFKCKRAKIQAWLSGTHNFTINTLVMIEQVMNIKILNNIKLKS